MDKVNNFELGIIGCGNMAKAILSGIFSSGFLKPHQVIAYDVNPETAAATEYEFNIRMAGDLTNLALNAAKLLVEAACDLGIKIEDANKLVLDTMAGSAEMLKKFNSDAGHLIKMVASPGGTTEAALDIFMKKQLDKIIKAAVNGAFNRAEKIQDKILHGD